MFVVEQVLTTEIFHLYFFLQLTVRLNVNLCSSNTSNCQNDGSSTAWQQKVFLHHYNLITRRDTTQSSTTTKPLQKKISKSPLIMARISMTDGKSVGNSDKWPIGRVEADRDVISFAELRRRCSAWRRRSSRSRLTTRRWETSSSERTSMRRTAAESWWVCSQGR